MTYDHGAKPLIEQLRVANFAEGLAIEALHTYLGSGDIDQQKRNELTARMTEAHEHMTAMYIRLANLQAG